MERKLKKVSNIMEMMAGNAVGASGGFSGKADAAGPVAGYDKPFSRKKYATGGRGSRKVWLDHLKNKK
jgi:hypothetical protein|tara:strand:+ start:716 stop:919 length:204 start_codon:yes stop_codon:yes gene_type:complete